MEHKNFRKIKCPLCGSDNERVLKVEKEDSWDFRIVQCRNCGLVYTNPQPTPQWVKDSHHEAEKVGFYSYEGAQAYHSHYINGIKLIKEHFRKGKLLDVGCGVGYFLRIAEKNGYDVSGIDFSSVASEVARDKFGLSITVGELKDIKIRKQSYDIITLWNVIEHFYDPITNISIIYKLLKKKGVLLIETPNILFRSWLLRFTFTKKLLNILQKDFSLIPWEHLFYWNPNTLRRLLLLTGFKKIKFYPINAPVESPLYNFTQFLKKMLFVVSNGEVNFYFPMVVVAIK